MNTDDLIQKLVDETMPNVATATTEVSCDVIELENYFQRRTHQSSIDVVNPVTNEKIQSNEISLQFSFKENLSVYRLDYNDEVWDFPVNWSIFEMMDEGCSITIKPNHRHAHLLEIFSCIVGKELGAIEFSFLSGKLTCLSHEQEQLAAA